MLTPLPEPRHQGAKRPDREDNRADDHRDDEEYRLVVVGFFQQLHKYHRVDGVVQQDCRKETED